MDRMWLYEHKEIILFKVCFISQRCGPVSSVDLSINVLCVNQYSNFRAGSKNSLAIMSKAMFTKCQKSFIEGVK